MSSTKTTKNSSSSPDVFTYHDYRSYLKDWLAHKKASQSSFSLRQVARQLDVSASYLAMVLSGERKLSDIALLKLAPILGFNASETAFMDQLRIVADSEDHDDRLAALKKLQRFSEYKKHNSQEIKVYRYLTRWYYVAIREMAGLEGFRFEERWIQKNLRKTIPLSNIRRAMNFLHQNNYIEIKHGESPTKSLKHLECSEGAYKLSLGQFHKQMFHLAIESIDNASRTERLITGHTLALSKDDYRKVTKILNEALKKVSALNLNEVQRDSVYHVCLAAFPLTGARKD